MTTNQSTQLPLHEFLVALLAWQTDQTELCLEALRSALDRLGRAYGVEGMRLEVELPPLPPLVLSTALGSPSNAVEHSLKIEGAAGAATLIVAGGGAGDDLAGALELSLAAAWSREQTSVQRRQLEALDLAVRSIAGITYVDRVLQLIVDRVRDLVGAQYAALGTIGTFGRIEQFLTSGITAEQRALIGSPPSGHGLIGLIIREDRSMLIDDIVCDPRSYGFPANHPEMHSFLGVPIHARGRSIGNLYLSNKINRRAFTTDDLALVERFALHAGIAIENARLHEELGRLAIVEERERISQDLHDSIIQSLYGISLSLEDLPDVSAEDPEEGAARADRAIDSIHATIRDIRNFIMGLQPELLSDADLSTGIRTLAAEFEANTLIDLEVVLDPDLPEVPRETAAHLLAITREALSNIQRHSGASRATLALKADDDAVVLVIGDNGQGFDVAAQRTSDHHGLNNLRTRADAIRASLNLTSETEVGTRLALTVPLNEDDR